jgi:hypothetical protein
MTPDPVLDWLTRLAPNGALLDPADVLFQAGRRSARTPRAWKLAVVGLLLANAVTVAVLFPRRTPSDPTEVAPAPVATPGPGAEPMPPAESLPGPDPNSIASLSHSFDPDAPPPLAGFVAPDQPPVTLAVGPRGATD